MIPFVIAVFLSYLLIPLAAYLEKLRIPALVANIIVIFGVLIILVGLVFLIYGALSSVAAEMPKYMQKYANLLDKGATFIQRHMDYDISQHYRNIRIEQLFAIISPGSVMSTINRSITTLIAVMSRLTLMMLFLMFIVFSRKVFINKVFEFFHANANEPDETVNLITNITEQIQTYLVLKTLISIGTGFAFGLVGSLFGLDFSLIWGFLGFVFNFIPTLGPIMASIPAIFLAFLQFDNMWYAFAVAFSMSAVQFVSGSFVEPLIMGDYLNLNIIAILLSLLLIGLIWGIPGMILAVPITAAINIICRNVESLRGISILLSK